MDDRLKHLLTKVVEDVIETAEPVGSQYLVDRYQLEVSPATIRNWFVELEQSGLIAQPHTSSGRVPTEKGYRFYVDELMPHKSMARRDQHELKQQAAHGSDSSRYVKQLAKLATEYCGCAAVVALGEQDTFYTGLTKLFSQPEFRDWQRMVTLSQVLDRLDDVMSRIRSRQFTQPIACIGADCPFGPSCSVIFLTLESNVLIGLLGPLRMKYAQAFSFLESLPV